MTWHRHHSPLTAILWTAALMVTPTAAQAQDADARIQEIRELYGQVQAGLDSYATTRKEYVQPGGSGVVETWREDGELRKLVWTFHGDGASRRTECFFHDGALFFAFERTETFPLWPDSDPDDFGPTERRFYFDGPRLVRFLERSHENEMVDESVPPGSDRFRHREMEILEEAELWTAFAASEEEDLEVFRESWAGGR